MEGSEPPGPKYTRKATDILCQARSRHASAASPDYSEIEDDELPMPEYIGEATDVIQKWRENKIWENTEALEDSLDSFVDAITLWHNNDDNFEDMLDTAERLSQYYTLLDMVAYNLADGTKKEMRLLQELILSNWSALFEQYDTVLSACDENDSVDSEEMGDEEMDGEEMDDEEMDDEEMDDEDMDFEDMFDTV